MKKLPKIVEDLLTAQNSFDSTAYSDCFDETAVVFDEARIHHGKTQIKNWIEKAAMAYKVITKPLEYSDTESLLKAEISGSFPGSPLVLNYQFTFKDERISSLKIS